MQGTTSFSGLTAHDVVRQSFYCHRDWDMVMHAHYLVQEEGFDAGYVEVLPIQEWLEALRG